MEQLAQKTHTIKLFEFCNRTSPTTDINRNFQIFVRRRLEANGFNIWKHITRSRDRNGNLVFTQTTSETQSF